MPTAYNPTIALPLIQSAITLVFLLVILRLLYRRPALRTLTWPYLIATFTLSAGLLRPLFVPQSVPLLDPILLAAQIFCWGYVGLTLAEYAFVERWARRRGVVVPRLAHDIVYAVAFVVGILIALQLVFNIAPSSIVISSTILSAVIGLALQDLLKNVIAGIALQLERPFEVGHWVQIDDGIGKVVQMSWRATRLVNVDGNLVIHPNSVLATSQLINYSLPESVQALHTQIALSYTHPPNVVKRVLTEAILASPFVSPTPPPSIKVLGYGDYSVTYDLKFWLFDYDRYPDKRDSVMTNAWYALQRAGLKMPLPVREIYTHEESPENIEQRRIEHLQRITADLRKSAVLAMLADTELAMLAERAYVRLYGIGDVLVRQGDAGDVLFIIRSGRVRVDVRNQDGSSVTVNQLGPGECFGEMALVTGEPRGASVIAAEDSEVLLVDKEALTPIMLANPELPERFGELLFERRAMTQSALELHVAAHPETSDAIPRATLGRRIREFFGMSQK
jgi:small-conductance mechanosensitive channel/CRP-like cAMP-binding protein